ncbi:MAG TPA: TolC family protein [Acidocella sp.]|jgi:outer membrane protein TolC|uniref:TolC family protein n=1 Tax=Acidocella sp. TaxID=50710 RepID=UPI002C72ED37|nr:TolC family protein [Acidocella sp.]HVE20958.1 TolC family protein [Acidocella sp.]
MRLNLLSATPWLLACCALAACASYRPAPLVTAPPLQDRPGALAHVLPDGRVLSVAGPLSLADVAALAVLNDPDLAAARARHDVAAAELLNAGLPPDPSISGGFAALLGGPASMSSLSAGFMEDVGALVTYKAARQAARAGLAQIDAGILWQEWQVVAQAEQLDVALATDRATIASLRQDAAALEPVDAAVRRQIAQSNQTLADGALAQAALATVQASLDTEAQKMAGDRDQLDALLGLVPGTDVPLAPPVPAPLAPAVIAPAIATLAQRRPDLIALRYGYAQADARLRASILGQFLPISLGASGGRDTSGVYSAGPQVTLTLPLFNRNRGVTAVASASRAELAAQYQASLAGAVGGARALSASIALLQTQAGAAAVAATRAAAAATAARRSFDEGQITALAFAGLQSAAGDRARTEISLRGQLQTEEISLATLLGLGLPPLGPAPKDSAS